MRGAIAAGNPHTAQAGARVLAGGGNAVDVVEQLPDGALAAAGDSRRVGAGLVVV